MRRGAAVARGVDELQRAAGTASSCSMLQARLRAAAGVAGAASGAHRRAAARRKQRHMRDEGGAHPWSRTRSGPSPPGSGLRSPPCAPASPPASPRRRGRRGGAIKTRSARPWTECGNKLASLPGCQDPCRHRGPVRLCALRRTARSVRCSVERVSMAARGRRTRSSASSATLRATSGSPSSRASRNTGMYGPGGHCHRAAHSTSCSSCCSALRSSGSTRAMYLSRVCSEQTAKKH
jgi:hypothetical protein